MLRKRNTFQERYSRFLQELREEIISGELAPGEFILPENTLSAKYNISRVSLRKALAELVDEGLIEKIAGKGNRVTVPEAAQATVTLRLAWFSPRTRSTSCGGFWSGSRSSTLLCGWSSSSCRSRGIPRR
ncbi:GntR family transcriptional regulator [Paenibacillus sp. CC-CFT747]|nr:GntR family transcriptional regulator [Paenibacillus sp. CC-CFT747]